MKEKETKLNTRSGHKTSIFITTYTAANSYVISFVMDSVWCMSNFAPSNISENSFIALCYSQRQCKLACYCATFHGTRKWHARTTSVSFLLDFHCTFNTHMIYTSNSLQFDPCSTHHTITFLTLNRSTWAVVTPMKVVSLTTLLSKQEGLMCSIIPRKGFSHVTHIKNSERSNFACCFCKFLLIFYRGIMSFMSDIKA